MPRDDGLDVVLTEERRDARVMLTLRAGIVETSPADLELLPRRDTTVAHGRDRDAIRAAPAAADHVTWPERDTHDHARDYMAVTSPKRDRPRLPKGYIKTTPKGMLSWPAAKKILTTAPYVWIATADDGGGAHLVQSWAVWIDDTLFFEGSEETRWARNIARDAKISFGFQHGDLAIYGKALAEIVRKPSHELAVKVARRYSAKYGKKFKYRPKPEQYEKGYVFRARPTKLIAFDVKRFNTSAARFTFETAAR